MEMKIMKLVYKGKTKDVYELEDGNVLFKFKDDATADADGNFDPGANAVGLTIDGLGIASLKMTTYYFELLSKKGVPTHFVSADIDNASMIVKPAKVFGLSDLEVICRFKAVGSFYRRYKAYCTEGMPLDSLVEITLKDDAQGDPHINKYGLIQLKILTEYEYATLVTMTKRIADILKDDFAGKGLELYDMKFEFGKIGEEIVLIDEISPGNVRVYKGDKWLQPLDMAEYFK
jgi:phosphoribosylaminoimidazole-succinocarboxamide synthase